MSDVQTVSFYKQFQKTPKVFFHINYSKEMRRKTYFIVFSYSVFVSLFLCFRILFFEIVDDELHLKGEFFLNNSFIFQRNNILAKN